MASLLQRRDPDAAPRPALYGSILALAAALAGCAGVTDGEAVRHRATDVWDVSLLPVRHIDLQSQAFGDDALHVTGLASAVVSAGDRLYVSDPGSRRLLEFSLATEFVRIVGSLRDASSPGLVVGDDGRVYALDQAARAILVVDPFSGQRYRVSLADAAARPVDLVLTDGYDLAVLDALDGRIVRVDVPGGVFREQVLRRPQHPVVASARAMALARDTILVLDDTADDVIGFDPAARVTGLFASDELRGARAITADSCGRFFVADSDDGTVYVGIPDMSVPGIRVAAGDLRGRDVTDLWTDDVFLYVATYADGIYVFLVDPGCD